jgi:hypothetical protein
MSILKAHPRLEARLLSIIKNAGFVIVSPLLLLISLIALVVVFVDFTCFRLRSIRYGESHPKGLWEF